MTRARYFATKPLRETGAEKAQGLLNRRAGVVVLRMGACERLVAKQPFSVHAMALAAWRCKERGRLPRSHDERETACHGDYIRRHRHECSGSKLTQSTHPRCCSIYGG